jgi:hypothetical protein
MLIAVSWCLCYCPCRMLLKHENEVRLPAADGPFMAVVGMPESARLTSILRVEAPPHVAWLMANIMAIEVVCAR